MGDTDSDSDSNEDEKTYNDKKKKQIRKLMGTHETKDSHDGPSDTAGDVEKGTPISEEKPLQESSVVDITDKKSKEERKRGRTTAFQLPKIAAGMTSMSMLEQSMPADAVLTKESAAEVS